MDNKDIPPELLERKKRVVMDTSLEATEYALAHATKAYQGIIDQIGEEMKSGEDNPMPPADDVARQFEIAWHEGLHGFLMERYVTQVASRSRELLDVKKDFNINAEKPSLEEIKILETVRQNTLASTAFRVLNYAQRNKDYLLRSADQIAGEVAKAEGMSDEFSVAARTDEIKGALKDKVEGLYSGVFDIVMPPPAPGQK